VNTLGIPQAHPARKERGTYIIHAWYGGVEVTLLFQKTNNTW
jgi:phenylalanyl-tRNA synthetase alpha subunit